MPSFNALPIMPKESKRITGSHPSSAGPYPAASSTAHRNAVIWNSKDDETLLRARASGLNWQPIANRHFPSKSANACRKRHERLMERRHVEDWDTNKLELLAQEYMACRQEMWRVLAERLGEKWHVVETKCMEKGFKTLSTVARTAQRKAAADSQSFEDRGIFDHTSDSGIGLGSDTEMEVGDEAGPSTKASSWHAHPTVQQSHQDHNRSRSLPQPLPLYQPPPPVAPRRTFEGQTMTTSPQELSFQRHSASQRCSPDSQNGRGGFSIQSIVSN